MLGPTKHLRWSYGASKAIDEFLALAYYRQHRLPVVIGRFFNVVGPRQTGRYGMVLPRFVDRALAGRPLIVHDDGQQVRCFAHVSDVCRMVVELMAEPQARRAKCSTSAATSRCRSWSWPGACWRSSIRRWTSSFSRIATPIPTISRTSAAACRTSRSCGHDRRRPEFDLDAIVRDVVGWKKGEGGRGKWEGRPS